MDVLALYNLRPQPTEKKRPINEVQRTVVPAETGVEYTCSNCSKINIVTSTSAIQCYFCDYRALDKTRKQTITLNAV